MANAWYLNQFHELEALDSPRQAGENALQGMVKIAHEHAGKVHWHRPLKSNLVSIVAPTKQSGQMKAPEQIS